jgi:anti-sigma28 factor (negative regulator of flagellin synthesis)
LFGASSSAEIYRGMLRENLATTMAKSLKSPFDAQFEQGMQRKIAHTASAASSVSPAAPAVVAPVSTPPVSGNSGGGLPVKGVITSPIGWRRDPIDGVVKFHKGTDIAAAYGTDVKSVSDGVVVESGPKGGYGNAVVVQLADGSKRLYGHNSANLVQVGERVQQGDVIAQVGATGHATGPHVHFEVIDAPTQISLKSVADYPIALVGRNSTNPQRIVQELRMSNIDRVNISNSSLDASYALQKQDQIRAGQNSQASSVPASTANDSVALSSTATDVDRFAGIVGQSRQDHIDQVSQMMSSGTYNVSSTDIAQKLIASNWK